MQLDKLIEIYRGRRPDRRLDHARARARQRAVDHPGSLLDRTSEAVYIARGVDSPYFGVLYDLYHSTVEARTSPPSSRTRRAHPLRAARGCRSRARHGRHRLAPRLADLRASGYDGPIGLEYYPQTASESRSATSATGGRRMSAREYPDAVDVVIVGGGPTGAAYARILSEQAPDASIAMFESGRRSRTRRART